MKKNIEIYVYHRVGRENALDGMTISKKTFSEQMKLLSRRNPITLGMLVRLMRSKKRIPSQTVVVTFDDGYQDTFKTALPILKKFRIPATVFITTGFIDQKVRGYQNAPMLSWNMVKKLQRAGIEIGAHTLTHPNLTQCSLREVRRQMTGSRKKLESKLGIKVDLFAYPYGGKRSFNKKIQLCAKQSGFAAACSTLPGMNGPNTNLYALRRLPPLRDEIRDLVTQMNRVLTKEFPQKDSRIQGISKKTKRIWMSQYKNARKFL